MKNIRINAIQILQENFKSEEGDTTFREFVEANAENDPNFFRWLFGAELNRDFNSSLTEEQETEYRAFLESIDQ